MFIRKIIVYKSFKALELRMEYPRTNFVRYLIPGCLIKKKLMKRFSFCYFYILLLKVVTNARSEETRLSKYSVSCRNPQTFFTTSPHVSVRII